MRRISCGLWRAVGISEKGILRDIEKGACGVVPYLQKSAHLALINHPALFLRQLRRIPSKVQTQVGNSAVREARKGEVRKNCMWLIVSFWQ
jgi:hypothetical protein